MLRRVTSSDPRFKTVGFHSGLNILVADKTNTSTDTDSRNGVGKSSLIEVLHFLLGMSSLTGSVLTNRALNGARFELEMDWPGWDDPLSVSRGTARRSRVILTPNVTAFSGLSGLPGEATIREWVEVIGRDLFGLGEEHPRVRARNLLGLYMRRVSQRSFSDVLQMYPTQPVAEAATNVAYLLGLDWRLAGSYQDLAARERLSRVSWKLRWRSPS